MQVLPPFVIFYGREGLINSTCSLRNGSQNATCSKIKKYLG